MTIEKVCGRESVRARRFTGQPVKYRATFRTPEGNQTLYTQTQVEAIEEWGEYITLYKSL